MTSAPIKGLLSRHIPAENNPKVTKVWKMSVFGWIMKVIFKNTVKFSELHEVKLPCLATSKNLERRPITPMKVRSQSFVVSKTIQTVDVFHPISSFFPSFLRFSGKMKRRALIFEMCSTWRDRRTFAKQDFFTYKNICFLKAISLNFNLVCYSSLRNMSYGNIKKSIVMRIVR